MNKLLIALTLIATFFANHAIALAPCDELEMIKHNCQAKVNQNYGDYSGVYEGEFMNGKRNGQGTFSFEDGGVYRGQWKDDKFHGQGVIFHSNGTELSGEFRNGEIVYGKSIYPNGDVYEGEWKIGKPNGKGRFVFYSGDKYNGEIKDGRMHGKGTMTYTQRRSNLDQRELYVGEWKRNLENGMGIMTYKDGSSYEGLFVNGSKDLNYEKKKIKADKEKALAKAKRDREMKLELERTCANKAGKASNDFAAKKIYESCMAANK